MPSKISQRKGAVLTEIHNLKVSLLVKKLLHLSAAPEMWKWSILDKDIVVSLPIFMLALYHHRL